MLSGVRKLRPVQFAHKNTAEQPDNKKRMRRGAPFLFYHRQRLHGESIETAIHHRNRTGDESRRIADEVLDGSA